MDRPEDTLPREFLDNNVHSVHKEVPTLVDEEDPSILMRTEVRQGSRLGDVRVRLVRPSHSMFRRLDTGLLEATEATQNARTPWERVTRLAKRILFGAPIATAQAEHERLTKFKALAVFSSD